MAFDSIYGQSRVKDMLLNSIQQKRLGHAYLFHGLAGIGKDAMAVRLGMTLNCETNTPGGCGTCPSCQQVLSLDHPSFSFVLPTPTKPKSMKEDKYREILRERSLIKMQNPYQSITYAPEISTLPNIRIEIIRSMKHEITLKRRGDNQRIFMISHAETMTIAASNSLLKMLEEPPDNTILILTSDNPAQLLPTIVSRCQSIRFDLLSSDEIAQALHDLTDLSEDRITAVARMSGGSLQRALTYSDERFEDLRKDAIQFFTGSLNQDPLQRLAAAELLMKHEKGEVLEMFKLLILFLRDLYFTALCETDKILNLDQGQLLSEISRQFPQLYIQEAIGHVEQAVDFIYKNVYLDVIVFSLNQSIFECLQQE